MAQQIRTGWRRFLGLEGRPQGSQCWPWSRLRAQSIKGPVGLAVGMALGAPTVCQLIQGMMMASSGLTEVTTA
jgi:hypothetical protein